MIESPWDEIILALSILQLIISIVRLLGYYLECGVLRVKRIFTTDDEYYKVSRFLSPPLPPTLSPPLSLSSVPWEERGGAAEELRAEEGRGNCSRGKRQ